MNKDQEKKVSVAKSVNKRFLPMNSGVMTKKRRNKALYRDIQNANHKFWGEDLNKKKGLCRKKKRFLHTTSNFGVKTSIMGVQSPKCSPVSPRLLLSFGAQSLRGGHISHLGAQKHWFGGHGPKVPPWRRACAQDMIK